LLAAIKAGKFEPYTSQYVTQELQDDKNDVHRQEMLALIDEYGIVVLPACEEAGKLAALYIANQAVKATYPTDAVHIAMTLAQFGICQRGFHFFCHFTTREGGYFTQPLRSPLHRKLPRLTAWRRRARSPPVYISDLNYYKK
jgi:hypothetical protein